MKLVEILAKELDEWPEGYSRVVQNPKVNEGWCLFLDDEQVSFDESQWDYVSFDMRIYKKTLDAELAADHEAAIVTRADWEAERAKLKVGQAVDSLAEERAKLKAPKANADGWIRHRGGKCPVEAGTRVSTKYRDGTITLVHHLTADPMASNVSLKTVWGHKKDQYDIMYYKPHKPTEQPALVNEETIKATEPGAPDTMLAIRDRIYALDTQRAEVESTYQRQISEITQERESLVQNLAGEGLALVEAAVQPVGDMSDWRNWKEGDSVEALGNSGGYTKGNTYPVKSISIERGIVNTLIDDRGSKKNGWSASMFKWHSRPAT